MVGRTIGALHHREGKIYLEMGAITLTVLPAKLKKASSSSCLERSVSDECTLVKRIGSSKMSGWARAW